MVDIALICLNIEPRAWRMWSPGPPIECCFALLKIDNDQVLEF